jgi:phenol/toluene 2-monooxygenase (NADH) P4/A4
MSVSAIDRYEFESSDALSRYNGRQLLYVNWEKHRMFSRAFVIAVSPAMPFSELIRRYIPDAYCFHPDFPKIDWPAVIWQNSDRRFTPDPSRSLADNGIGHKDLIRFTTPGLDGLAGSGY